MSQKWVKKASGEIVQFDEGKLKRSLFNSGASEELIEKITNTISENLTETTSTRSIYKRAYQLLRTSSQKLAGKYKLKTAILELGPSGYPFEHFVGQLLAYQGYDVEVGIEIQGKCLSHEVDIFAHTGRHLIIGECKHHGNPGYKSDIKVPLYIHSRYNDIIAGLQSNGENREPECWIITNTRFTTDSEQYGSCYGLKLIAWDFPKKGNLRERVELSGLYPITCLFSLTKREKQILMDEDIVLCQQISANPDLLKPIDPRKHSKILAECQEICSANS